MKRNFFRGNIMEISALFSKIDSLYPEYVKVWEDICRLESPTADKVAVDRVGEYLTAMATKRGWKVEVCRQEKSGDALCFTLNPDVDASPVTMSGHIDTVYPIGYFPAPLVHTDSEKIYGPGVTDCKGGVVSSFMAMDALWQLGFKDRPVKLVVQTDEEVGSLYSDKATIEFMCKCAEGSAAFLNTEGMANGKAVLLRKGIMRCELTVEGIEGHSSACPNAANAIAEAAYKIIELEKMKDINGLTCNCGVISGGTTPNTVAGKCSFYADIRFLTNEELERAKATVERLASQSVIEGCKTEYKLLYIRPALEYSEKNFALFDRVNELNEKLGLKKLESVLEPSGSDAAYTSAYGIPTIDNLGVCGGAIHSKDEFAYLDSLRTSARQLAVIAAYI